MSLTFTVYHTCHLAGSLDNIFRNSPYECDTNDKQWLGVGYYFWTDSEYFAQKWGELDRKYPKGYVITEYQVEIPEESFLDLVGNVKDQLFFRKQILDYVERQGYTSIRLLTRNTNTYSVNLYTKLGYQVVKTQRKDKEIMQTCEKILKVEK